MNLSVFVVSQCHLPERMTEKWSKPKDQEERDDENESV